MTRKIKENIVDNLKNKEKWIYDNNHIDNIILDIDSYLNLNRDNLTLTIKFDENIKNEINVLENNELIWKK